MTLKASDFAGVKMTLRKRADEGSPKATPKVFTEEEKDEIRSAQAPLVDKVGWYQELAKEYGCHWRTIVTIRNGK